VKVRHHEAADAFDQLFLEEYARVVAIAQRVLGDAHEAEDVAQDVFCSFHRRHSPDAPYAAAWLHRAAAHAALNVVRGARRRRQRETADALQRDRLQGVSEEMLDPQRAVEEAEERREVHEALARLPAKSSLVLALRYSGLSYAEVAAALGVGIGQVGTLLRRAEAALRKEMTRATPQ
jgi:RNA polymerase sigma-70 factor (ECF subfamily)